MGKLKSPPLLEMWLPADPKAVPGARREAQRVCSKIGIAEDDCFTLDLALGEALANAVLHGAPVELSAVKPGEHVCLCLWHYDGHLIIHVRDLGPGFEPPPPPYHMPAAHHHHTSGRGLPLMETLTDAMMVCRGDAQEGGASVYLIKSLPRHLN